VRHVEIGMAWSRVLFVLLLMTTAARASSSNDDLRVQLHLERVETLLRARMPEGLREVQRARRERMLEHLHAYIERGEFPRNHERAGRRPHFIDEEGRICAVGYLIEQTAGRAAAESINARHEWGYIEQIRGIEAWVNASGLTVSELALIQPSYEWEQPVAPAPRPPPPPIDPETMQRRQLAMVLGAVKRDVDRCAVRFESRSERVTVTATVRGPRALDIAVSNAGERGFERCVGRAARALVERSAVMRGGLYPVSTSYTITLRPARRDEGGRFAQPPPH
jgi:hypothetical protein